MLHVILTSFLLGYFRCVFIRDACAVIRFQSHSFGVPVLRRGYHKVRHVVLPKKLGFNKATASYSFVGQDWQRDLTRNGHRLRSVNWEEIFRIHGRSLHLFVFLSVLFLPPFFCMLMGSEQLTTFPKMGVFLIHAFLAFMEVVSLLKATDSPHCKHSNGTKTKMKLDSHMNNDTQAKERKERS